jgi:hypothetical protein
MVSHYRETGSRRQGRWRIKKTIHGKPGMWSCSFQVVEASPFSDLTAGPSDTWFVFASPGGELSAFVFRTSSTSADPSGPSAWEAGSLSWPSCGAGGAAQAMGLAGKKNMRWKVVNAVHLNKLDFCRQTCWYRCRRTWQHRYSYGHSMTETGSTVCTSQINLAKQLLHSCCQFHEPVSGGAICSKQYGFIFSWKPYGSTSV